MTQIVDRRLNGPSEPVDRGRVVGGDRGGGARRGAQRLGGVQLSARVEVNLGDVSLKYISIRKGFNNLSDYSTSKMAVL